MKKCFWGSMPPHPPSACVLTLAPSSVPPQSYIPSAASAHHRTGALPVPDQLLYSGHATGPCLSVPVPVSVFLCLSLSLSFYAYPYPYPSVPVPSPCPCPSVPVPVLLSLSLFLYPRPCPSIPVPVPLSPSLSLYPCSCFSIPVLVPAEQGQEQGWGQLSVRCIYHKATNVYKPANILFDRWSNI